MNERSNTEYSKHDTFLSMLLGNTSNSKNKINNSINNSNNKINDINNLDIPFSNDDNTDLQFSHQYVDIDHNNDHQNIIDKDIDYNNSEYTRFDHSNDKKINKLLMSDISFKSEHKNKNDDEVLDVTEEENSTKLRNKTRNHKKLRSNVSINFYSESESSDNENDNDNDNDNDNNTDTDYYALEDESLHGITNNHNNDSNFNDKTEQHNSNEEKELNTTYNIHNTKKLSNNDKNQIREQLEIELGFDDYISESLLLDDTYRSNNKRNTKSNFNQDSNIFNKLEQSFMYQVKEAERKFGPTLNSMSKKAKKIAKNTLENSVLQPPPPTFISNRRPITNTPNANNSDQSNLLNNQEYYSQKIFNARKLPPKDRAYWMWANVTNLDLFLSDVYNYYIGNGWQCIALSKVFDILIIIFVIWLTSFIGNCIDYNILFNKKVTKLGEVYDGKCYSKIPFSQKIFYLILISLLLLRIKNCFKELSNLKEIQLFYNYLLNINDSELQTITWPQIVKKIMILKNQNTNAIVNDNNKMNNDLKSKNRLNAHDIANRLMRKENYLIGLFNKNILTKPLTIPYFNIYFLTNTLEWNLKLCVIDFLFNDEGQLVKKILSEHNRLTLINNLNKRFRMAGLLSIILTPFLVAYFILYYFLKLFYDFKTNPGLLNARSYSPYAKWRMREYNELPHIFDQRLNLSIENADNYLDQFPKELANIILKFISFITGSIVTILVILTIIDHENFLNFELTQGKTVLFYMSTLGAIFTVCKNSISLPHNKYLFDPEGLLKKVANDTHYLPTSWENRYHTVEVKNQFCKLYNLKIILILKELASLILLPYILYFQLPKYSGKIIDFFRDYTVHVDGIGYICSFAMFNLDENSDHVYNNCSNDDDDEIKNNDYLDENDDKMVKSYMYFLESYRNGGLNGNINRNNKADITGIGADTGVSKRKGQLSKRRNGTFGNQSLAKSAILNHRNGNYKNVGSNKMPIYKEQMEETSAGLYSMNTKNYIDNLNNSMILGESFQLGYGKDDYDEYENRSDKDWKDDKNNDTNGGVLGLLNNIYKDKKSLS